MPKVNISLTMTDDAGKTFVSSNEITLTEKTTTTAPAPAPTEPIATPTPTPTPTPTAGLDAIPLAFNSPQFSGNVSSPSITLQRGQNLSKKTITDTGHTASVICLGGNTLDYVNIKSREGIRIAGSGDFRVNNSRIEVNGSGSDHADGIQTYSPGDRGRIIVRNSTIKCGLEAATAGLFIADNWTGNTGSEDYTLDLENVVFHGGPFGLRAHSDSNGDVRVALKDVFFVGPFKYKPFLLSGENGTQLRIMKWENVRTATISADGKLVPGSLIARP